MPSLRILADRVLMWGRLPSLRNLVDHVVIEGKYLVIGIESREHVINHTCPGQLAKDDLARV